MKKTLILLIITLFAALPLASNAADAPKFKPSDLLAIFPGIPQADLPAYFKDGGQYVPATALNPRPDVPKGRIVTGRLEESRVFPGMPHDYSVYVPAQYRADSPACLLVVLDGSGFLQGAVPLPTLLDNLIADGVVPVMIGLFANPGPTGPGYPVYGGHTNRAVEYDSVGQDLSRFIVDELMPRVAKDFNISRRADCHGIMGESSGGSAAFGVAWNRPDVFGKVISIVGSYTNIRGADAYPSIVRRSDRKPIRVFLQDGSNDLDTVYGNWPLANKEMAAALAYRGYDYRFEFGEGGHNLRHFASLALEAMRWLWRE